MTKMKAKGEEKKKVNKIERAKVTGTESNVVHAYRVDALARYFRKTKQINSSV